MKTLHEVVAAMLLPCLLMTGCQSSPSPRPAAIVTYQPGIPARECEAPGSRVYVLLRMPTTMPTAAAGTPGDVHRKSAVAVERPVEVERVYAGRGVAVGFRQSGTELLALAGPTEKPLVEARYAWRVARRMPSSNGLHPRPDAVLRTTLGVAAVVSCTALILWAIHDDRHSLPCELFNPN